MFQKEETKKYCERLYNDLSHYPISELVGFDGSEEVSLNEFQEKELVQMNCFDSFFEQINAVRFEDKLLLEFIKLGDLQGFYKDWALHKYMSMLYATCKELDEIYINNYEYDEDDPMFRAFFIAMLIDINQYNNFNEIYLDCKKLCESILMLTDKKLTGSLWLKEYECDEPLFCRLFLTPYFKKIGFSVFFNHGNREFGKDYILIVRNIFGENEYLGVQVKAGDIRGTSTSDIIVITNQINIAFTTPYKLTDGREIYISKLIIVISGYYTDNAKEIISHNIERYKMTNLIFLSKKELENV